jgi:hypothetical protein
MKEVWTFRYRYVVVVSSKYDSSPQLVIYSKERLAQEDAVTYILNTLLDQTSQLDEDEKAGFRKYCEDGMFHMALEMWQGSCTESDDSYVSIEKVKHRYKRGIL